MEDCNIKKRKILGKGRYLTQYKNILSSMYFDKNEIENGIISLEESDEILDKRNPFIRDEFLNGDSLHSISRLS